MKLWLNPEGGVAVRSTGEALGERRLTLAQLAASHGWSDATVQHLQKAAGAGERCFVAEGTATSQLAARAGRQALSAGATLPGEVDRLVVATISPDTPVPACAPRVSEQLGLAGAPAFDVGAACSGFLYGLDLAARFVRSGDQRVLVVAADVRSHVLPWHQPGTAALFGDGAGAALIGPCAAGAGLLGTALTADGAGADAVTVPAGGSRTPITADGLAAGQHLLHMTQGPELFLKAIEGMVEAGAALLSALGLSWDDVDVVVPHQPNGRATARLARFARIPEERVWSSFSDHANLGGATLAVGLHRALAAGRLPPGGNLLLVGAGAGFTAGAALLRRVSP